MPVRFLVHGFEYRILGLILSDVHLLGVEGAGIGLPVQLRFHFECAPRKPPVDSSSMLMIFTPITISGIDGIHTVFT